MISFELRSFRRTYFPMNITCKVGDERVRGITSDISPKGFCLEVPTPRIKMCLLEALNKDVILQVENVLIYGSIRWYTIEGDRYRIGISISKGHLPTWKRLLAEATGLVVSSGMNHVQA